jgi:cell division protein ZapA
MHTKDEGRLVTVDINGLRYPIRSNLDPAYVADLAAYVEEKMQLASRESPAGDTLKIAVLAALNIADECFRARLEGASHRSDLTERALELERMLDLALGSPDPAAADAPAEPPASPLARTAGSF